jgi:hypothetical protein
MKAAKYAQLLSDSTALLTTINFNSSQLNSFANMCSSACAEINSNLTSMNANLLALNANQLAPSKQELEQLNSIIKALEQITKKLKQELEKPALDYRKSIEKTEKEINEKILPILAANAQGCVYDLKFIHKLIEQIKPLIEASKQKLNNCFADIIKAQDKLAAVDILAKSLDLPNEIEQTTSHIEKMTKELANLNLHLATQADSKQRYQREFLPLRAALSSLRLQSLALDQEPPPEVKQESKDVAPRLKV